MPRLDPDLGWLQRQWLAKAELDLKVAILISARVSEDRSLSAGVAFHCQQAAEKYLKALLTNRQIDFPKTHDLSILLKLLETRSSPTELSHTDARWLTPFGVDIRYPGDSPEMLPGDELRAIEIATKVKQAVLDALAS